jgi:AraC-like DNA-binding protein
MLGSALTAFFEPEDFEAALLESGDVELVTTKGGKFRARLSRISLDHMRLFACEERMSRVALMSVSANMVRVTLPPRPHTSLMWDGIGVRPGEIVTHLACHHFYERVKGTCRWSTMWLPASDLARGGRAMRGKAFAIPSGKRRWRPAPAALKCLIGLHENAIRATTTRPKLSVEGQAAHGLEQQLMQALLDCLTVDNTEPEGALDSEHANLMTRFEDALHAGPLETLSVVRLAEVLGISTTVLRACCHSYLGTTPSRYIYIRRLRLVRQALRSANSSELSVAQIAEQHGFRGSDRFTEVYSAQFGESPSVTLRRSGLR